MAIHHWPAQERPREKLLQRGPGALSDAELLAIFLRTGHAGKSAVDLARDLVSEFGSLSTLLNASQEAFCASKGLGPAKYTQLQAQLRKARGVLIGPCLVCLFIGFMVGVFVAHPREHTVIIYVQEP